MQLTTDMDNTIKLVKEGGNDIHGSLRLPSALARHAALAKEGEAVIKMAAGSLLVPQEQGPRQQQQQHHQPSSPSDPHEQVVRQTLEGLKVKLDLYREVMEGRQSSPLSSQGGKALAIGGGSVGGGKRQVAELVIQQKTSSPAQVRKEGVLTASSPLQIRKVGTSDASSPGPLRKEGVSIASSPGQVRKEEAAKDWDLLPMLVTEVSSSPGDVKTCASSGDATFSVCLTIPLRANFGTGAARDFPMRVPRPTLSLPLETSPTSKPTVTTTKESGAHLTKRITPVAKATLTKCYSLDLISESGVDVERNQRESTPPTGKVSSLRCMFNAMTTNSTPSLQPQTQSQSVRAKSTPPPQPQTQSQSVRAKSTPPSLPQTQSQSSWDTPTSPPVRFHSPDIIPMERRLSPINAPPRPPSPLNYNPDVGGSGLLESDCDSLSTFASSADEEREEEEEVMAGVVEETDNDGRGQAEPKKTRSTG